MSRPHFPQLIRDLWGSSRAFKIAKRRELRKINNAVSAFALGSWYVPPMGADGNVHLQAIRYHLKMLRNEMRVTNWGRS